MTVPTQRGSSQEEPTVLSMILGAVQDVKTGMAHVTSKIDGLDQKFMPRAEYEARHSDLRNTVTQLDGRLMAEGKEREALEDKLTQGRRWAFIATFTALGAFVGFLGLLITIITILSHLN